MNVRHIANPDPKPFASHRLAWTLVVLAVCGAGLLARPDVPNRRSDGPSPAPLERLTSRSRPDAPKAESLRVGDDVATADRPRRVALPDGSVLLFNRDTRAKLETADQLTLSSGEVFVEKYAGKGVAPFVIRADGREVRGSDAFAVRSAKDGPAVVVVRGAAEVTGLKGKVEAGQRLDAGAERPEAAPRLSHVLDWTRQPLAAAESPLVPGSQHNGGSLIAVDPDGQEAKLSLRKYHVDVHVENGFARTTIDQTYFNHHSARLEGTFYFPLPPDASLSRLAMYVDGNLMEGGMAERDIARSIYETIRYAQRDPALLEWVDGSTFKMRVFPLEPRQEKRLILSYTQRLPVLYGRATYRFPAGHTLDSVREWSFHARLKGGAKTPWASDSHALKPTTQGDDLLLDATEKDARLDRDVVLHVDDGVKDAVRFSSAEHEGSKYLMVRYRPELPSAERRERRDWVVMFESSGDRDPLLARAQIEVVRGLLSQAEAGDTLAVLTASTRTQRLDAVPRPATPENVEAALDFLEKAHLVGALDLGRALDAAVPLLKAGRNAHLVHVGSGIAAMGEKRDSVLSAKLPEGTRYVGIGVGRRWGRSFMKVAAEKTGGLFTQINPDEPIAWRAFEVASTLGTPRALDLKCADAAGSVRFLPFGSTAAQGEEFAAVAQIAADEKLPEEVVITGRVDGRPIEQRLRVGKADANAGHLPRTWASLEIERLLAKDAAKHKERVIGLSKAMYVMTPFTSLLVLESEDQYVQFKVDRGRKDHWAMYPAPEKIRVVTEPDPDAVVVEKGRKPAKLVAATVVARRGRAVEYEQWAKLRDRERSGRVGQVLITGNGRETPPQLSRVPHLGRLFRNVGDGASHRMAIDGLDFAVPSPAAPEPSPVPLAEDDFRRVARPEPRHFDAEDESFAQSVSFARMTQNDADQPVVVAQQRFTTAGVSGIQAQLEFTRRKLDPSAVRNMEKGEALEELGLLVLRDGTQSGTPLNRWKRPASGKELFSADRLMDEKSLGEVFDSSPPSLLYSRPSFNVDDARFFDLIRYAPGMHTTAADLLGVLEAEAIPSAADRPGRIDDAARRLIDRARDTGWQSLTLLHDGKPSLVIRFDGTGRFAWERSPALGLREMVICDGKTLLHLYPDLGIGARRSVSRFHREDFAGVVPWAVPSAEDFAHGCDVTLADEHTVAIVPHEPRKAKADEKPARSLRLHLIFADGRLAERHVVEVAEGKTKVLVREVCGADGVVKVLDGDGKELHVHKGKLDPAAAPAMTAETKNLVVLPLPYRTVDHVRTTLKIQNKGHGDLRFDEGLPLFAAWYAAGNGNETAEVFRQCFRNRDQRHLGFHVLLASLGQNLDAEHLDVQSDHPDDALAQHLAVYSSPVLRKHASQWAVTNAAKKEGFLYHLALTHSLLQRWGSDRVTKLTPEARRTERERALHYVRSHVGSGFAWALLCAMQDRADKDRDAHAELAEAFKQFEKTPGLEYAARYEHARSLLRAGHTGDARREFRALYDATLKEKVLPAIDRDFRTALVGEGDGPDEWSGLLRGTAGHLIEQKHRPAVLTLALQVWQLGDESRANYLLGLAADGITDPKERVGMTMAAIEWLWLTRQITQADQTLQPLLEDKEGGNRPLLWRMAAKLAEGRDRPGRAMECLSRALDLEFASLPEVIDVKQVREEYGKLLEHYRSLAESMETLKVDPPADFLPRVVRLVDRWRSLDREGVESCRTAGRILQVLGDRELAWDYLTTPVGLRPNESGPWSELAGSLARRGDLDLADRAFRAAAEAEPSNAQLLWDRAENLKRAGKVDAARGVFRQVAEGDWQPRFRWLKEQAKSYADGR